MTNAFPQPVTVSRGPLKGPLVVLLHGRGPDAAEIIGLAAHLPADLSYTALRAPITAGGGFAWFENRGIGRPLADSLAATIAWFRTWLDSTIAADRPVLLVGFSGGAAFAGGLVLADPKRFAGAAILNGTLPFDAGISTEPGQLLSVSVFLAHGTHDNVIPHELQTRTWTYLTAESRATTVARHDNVGHSIAQPAIAALATWLSDLTKNPT